MLYGPNLRTSWTTPCFGLPLPWYFLDFYVVANSRAILRLIPNVIFYGMILLSTQICEVVIKRSKTDPFRRGCRLAIGSSRNKICPVRAMKTYMLQSAPIYVGAPLTRTALTSHLRRLLRQQGLDETLYASHSFRIGAATAAGSTGLPTWLIKTLGRWSSDCYERYIRTPKDCLVSIPCQLNANVSY